MATELCIFLSHKKGDSDRNARRVAADLAMFGGANIKIFCSANFPAGEKWEPKIREGLAKSHWLVLLYTGPHTDWDWCLYETGYFRALMENDPNRKLICLHDPSFEVPAPLRDINHVPATEMAVTKLFEDIYRRDPWKLNPDIFENNLEAVKDAVRRVCANCRFGNGPARSLQITPLINIRVKKTELSQLEKGTIPGSCPVNGVGNWEILFGKPEATAGWTWGELVGGVVNSTAWEYQLAVVMSEVTKQRSVQYPSILVRILIKGPDDKQQIYRFGLRRMAEYEEDFEFSFVASRVRAPFEPAEDDNATMLYHLFNMAWHFRRRFIEYHRKRMEDLSDNKRGMELTGREKEFHSDLNEAVQNIRVDLKALEAEAQVRGFDRASAMRRAFPQGDRNKMDRLLNDLWPPLYQTFTAEIQKDEPKPAAIADVLGQMEPLNKWFYQRSLELLRRVCGDTTEPRLRPANGEGLKPAGGDSEERAEAS